MEVIAISKNVRQSPRKLRLVAAMAKKLPLGSALDRLALLPKSAAKPIRKTLQSALSNAVTNAKIDEKSLSIKNILVDEGFRMKRYDKSHSYRFNRGLIQKQAAHVTVILEDKKEKEDKKDG